MLKRILATTLILVVILSVASPGLGLGANQSVSPSPRSAPYSFTIGPGGSYHNVSNLLGDIESGYRDSYLMTVTSTTTVTILVVDCCLLGDTICLGFDILKKSCAYSPHTDSWTRTLDAGTYAFNVWYDIPNTGVFPAGYDVFVTAS